jgi:DNA-binding LytR/AlgR family response regulator
VTLRTLVVDDERLARERVTTLVRDRAELTLIGEAQDGRTALDLIVEHRPDLVFLDVQMPELDGFQIIGALDGDGASLPAVVFVTAYDAYALRAFEVAAMDYLLKPVTAERFAAAVSRVLARTAQRSSGVSLHAFAEQAAAARSQEPSTTSSASSTWIGSKPTGTTSESRRATPCISFATRCTASKRSWTRRSSFGSIDRRSSPSTEFSPSRHASQANTS